MKTEIITCIIVDDEPIGRDALARYVEEIDFLLLVGSCKNALEANNMLKEKEIDLVFLDIHMPMMSGLEWLSTLTQSPLVIFTTAHPEYAIESYQFDVVDYLLKPISFQRFLQAANKAQRFLSSQERTATEEEDYIFVKTDQQLVKLQVTDILYIESMQNYILFHTASEKIMTLVPLKQAIEMLPTGQFLQVHKSYVVAKDKVEAIEGNQLILGGQKVPVSVRLRKGVVDELMRGKLLRK
ncbi:MAG: LytTR family DNA-binding domain-containing protein [Saprospiraceae bacterium]|nr:LytTR family DNA-binding domain-containing protein [Saprospiraceae bacterium]